VAKIDEIPIEELEQARLRLAACLPPILTNEIHRGDWGARPVCIDLEWHTDKCKCGVKDRPDGALECVGVGNETLVSQFWWQDLDVFTQHSVKAWVEYLVRHHPVLYHGGIADLKKLRENGFDITVECHDDLNDTMLADAVINSEGEHTLFYLTANYGSLPQHKHLQKYAPKEYNAGDLVETCVVWAELVEQFKKDPDAWRVYVTMSLAFLSQQLESDEGGLRVDKTRPLPLYDKFSTKAAQGQALANAAVGHAILLSSPEQVMHELYNVREFPVQRTRDKVATSNKDAIAFLRKSVGTEWDAEDEPSLAEAWSNIEAGGDPFLEAKYLYSGAAHSLSNYVMPFLLTEGEDESFRILGVRDRIYPECRVHSQASGRHGYVQPPMTQFRGVVELQVTPDVGFCWIGHDWSNIETWHLGALARDPLILMAKALAWDTHTVNFCDGTGTPYPPKMTKAIHTCPCSDCTAWRREFNWQGDEDLRRTFFKRFVYRLHYRGLPENCGDIPGARALKMDVGRLIQASEMYLAKHRPIRDYWAAVDDQVDREGLVRTFMGRPRRLESEYRNARLREASNHGMQGGVADIYITTAIAVKARAPWARLMYGKFDSQWWQVPNGRRLEFASIYAPIVEREFNVNGQRISYPASYKLREAA